ncbi:MAG: hypothetical protein U9Q03_06430 [Patescibacteria group bacterium]|nr:hypothetical protein [Patescibacteria group bacterium]
MSFWRKPEPKSNGAVLFLFIGIVLTLLLAGVVFGKRMVGEVETAVKDTGTRGVFDALSVGTSDIVGPLEVAAFADRTYVFGYRRENVSMAGMVQWDGRERQYVLRSEIPLSAAPNGFASVSDIVAGPDWGISPVVELRGPSLADPLIESVAFLVVHGANLAQVPFAATDGIMPAEFSEGSAGALSWSVRVEDVTGDGAPEILQRESYRLGEVEVEEIRAYTWDCGRLAFDERLSWALTVRGEIFPEPQ